MQPWATRNNAFSVGDWLLLGRPNDNSEQRRKLVDLRADLTNVKGKTACDFLNRWPSLEALQRVKPTTIRRFLKSHRVGGSEKLHSKLEEIKQARALTHDAAIGRQGVSLERGFRWNAAFNNYVCRFE